MCLANVPVTSTKHESAKNTVSELWGHITIRGTNMKQHKFRGDI